MPTKSKSKGEPLFRDGDYAGVLWWVKENGIDDSGAYTVPDLPDLLVLWFVESFDAADGGRGFRFSEPPVGTPEYHAHTAWKLSKRLDGGKRSFGPEAMRHLRLAAKLPALSPTAAAVYGILCDLPEHRALTGPLLIEALAKLHPPHCIDQSTLTVRIIPELRPYGIENQPRIGYRIPVSHRPPENVAQA